MQQKRSFNPLKSIFKSRQEKLLEKIRKKKIEIDKMTNQLRFEQNDERRRRTEVRIDKLKEEIIKMGKYALRDGKLVKKDDTTVQSEAGAPSVPEGEMPLPPVDLPEALIKRPPLQAPVREPEPFPPGYGQEANIQTQPQPQKPQQPQQPQMTQEQYIQLQEIEKQRLLDAQMRQQQARAQATAATQAGQEVTIFIKMTEGESLNITIPFGQLDDFVGELATAISESTTMQINNRVINGRHIVFFTF